MTLSLEQTSLAMIDAHGEARSMTITEIEQFLNPSSKAPTYLAILAVVFVLLGVSAYLWRKRA